MFLQNLKIPGLASKQDILLQKSRIQSVLPTGKSTGIRDGFPRFFFEKAMVFPGLINSHDHLEFNLFPSFGDRIYENYTQWGHDLHSLYKSGINRVLEIPLQTRINWGLYKNLLNGFTTVVNHGQQLPIENSLVRVIQQKRNLHSVQFEKKWKWKLNKPFHNREPIVVHAGEGIDQSAHDEIDDLIRWNLFGRNLIAVHGVAMHPSQARSFQALVWCPGSNYFLLNKTAPVDQLAKETRIIFGTDSTLTADWNSWSHFRLARQTGLVQDPEFFDMLTRNPAIVWNLPDSGEIAFNKQADLVICDLDDEEKIWDSFFALDPGKILLIIQNGEIRLMDESLAAQAPAAIRSADAYSRCRIGNRIKFVHGRLDELIQDIEQYKPDAELPVENV